MIDARGQFMEVHKRSLLSDPAYRRDLDEGKIAEMVRRWSWTSCAVLLVTRRDGQLFVFDGQHRLAAARRLGDIDTLPCLIFAPQDAPAAAARRIRGLRGGRP
jgi:hypothetical protein